MTDALARLEAARRSALIKLAEKQNRIQYAQTPFDLDFVPGGVITPHGGSSVDHIPEEDWPTMADLYAMVDPGWRALVTNKKAIADMDKRFGEQVRAVGMEDDPILRRDYEGDVAKLSEFGREFEGRLDTLITEIIDRVQNTCVTISATCVGKDGANTTISMRFNPILRQFEMSELFRCWGVSVRDIQRSLYLKSATLRHFKKVLGRYCLELDESHWPMIQRMYATVQPNPYDPGSVETRWVWVPASIYPALMEAVTLSDTVPGHMKADAVRCHECVKDLGRFADHATKLQTEFYVAINVALKHGRVVSDEIRFSQIQLREWQVLIIGNMRSLAAGAMSTVNDLAHHNDMELWGWGMLKIAPDYRLHVKKKVKNKTGRKRR